MKLLPNPLLFVLPILGPLAFGQGPYRYTDLGDLGGGESVALGLNDAGDVVGWSTIPGCATGTGTPCRRAFLWKDGVLTDLGVLPGDEESTARGINDLGQIVGTSEANVVAGSGDFRAVTWNGSGPVALPHLGQADSVFAYDINDSGQIAGHAYDPTVSADRAVVWQGTTLLPVGQSEPHTYNRLYGINEQGHVIGSAWELFQPGDSIVYDGAWQTIGGTDSPWQNSEAFDLSDAGHRVGLQAFPSGNWHPAYWAPGAKAATDAGLLPGHDLGRLLDVNDAGVAVGRTYQENPPFESRAILFDGTTLFDLNELLVVGTDAHLFEAAEVNENGDIAGTTLGPNGFRAFLLEPMKAWTPLGGGTGGAGGKAPVLQGFGSLEGDEAIELRITEVPPAAPVILVAGTSQVSIPLLGGILIPAPEQIFTPQLADATGSLTMGFDWPAGVAPGVPTYWQGWVVDASGAQGFTSTNAALAWTE